MDKRYVYVMLSKTDTGMGKIIRVLSRYQLNHVSVTLDPTLRSWVSFARYVHDTTLYGGFVREPAERFLARGYDVQVRIFRIEISEERYRTLQTLFARAGQQDGTLIYNLFDVAAAAFRCKVEIPGAYTCLSFACAVLGKRYMTIEALDEALSENLYYEGPLESLVSDSGDRSDLYFSRLGFFGGLRHTAKSFGILLRRMVCHRCGDRVRALYTL